MARYLPRGLYVNYLHNYANLPSQVPVHILCFNEIAKSEEKFKKRLRDTLSLKASAFQKDKGRKYSRSTPRSLSLAALVKKIALLLMRHFGFTALIQRVKYSLIPLILYSPTKLKDELVPREETLRFMRSFFAWLLMS